MAAVVVVGVGLAGVSCGDDVGEGEAVVAEFALLIVQVKAFEEHHADAEAVRLQSL